MNATTLYMRTMPYTLARFGLALLFAALSGILMIMCLRMQDSLGVTLAQLLSELLQEDLGEDGPLATVFLIWLSGTIGLRFIFMHYAGYLLKAGHLAVVSHAFASGIVPPNQMAFGKKAVLDRFGESHAYLLLDRLLDAAVGQLCKGVSKVEESFKNVPGADVVSGVTQIFLGIALGHVDECCLSLSFHRKSGNAFKDAADSVVLYFQNWQNLLKNAGVATLVCCLLYAVLGVISFIIFACFMDADKTGMPAAFAAVFFFHCHKVVFYRQLGHGQNGDRISGKIQ